jgi:phosphoglycerate-specific signal transduction histidine kinase
MPGWIKIHRQFLDHWLCNEYRPLTKREAWENMLLWANYAEVDVLIKGQVIKCGRGQLVYSLETLSEKFNWSVGATRHFLKLLQKDNMILVEGLKYTTRITICNYDKYQDEQQTDNKLKTFSQHSDDKLEATRKEIKEGEEVKKVRSKPNKSADFIDEIVDQFVQAHGSYEVISIGKERAAAGKLLKVYKDKYPKATSDEIIKSLRQYFNQCVAINDTWLKSNMSLPIIIDKFNQINHILKNGSQKLKFTEADFK